MNNPLYKQIRISWEYPQQPTSLQVGNIRIVRSTEPFEAEAALAQTQIDYREYDPSFTSFVDTFELENDVTYYYMIVVYGDTDSTISAATELYSVKIETSQVTIPPNEMHFTTTEGTIDYYGVEGDQILLSDGNIVDVTISEDVSTFNVPSGKHKVILVETRSDSYVSLGGEALVELHNFPTSSSVDTFDTYPSDSSPNLVKVPTVLPSNLTGIGWMFYGATSFNQDISNWDVSNVTDMRGMFQSATAFNQDLSQWCVSKIIQEPDNFSTNSPLTVQHKPVWGTCPSSSGGTDEPISQWRTMNELKLLTDVGEFRGYYSGFGAPSGHALFLDMLNNYQEVKASFYTYGADQLIGEVDLTEYLPTLKQLIIDYPTGFNAGTNMWYTDIYKNKDVSDMSPQFQTLIEAVANHFGVWTGMSTITLQFEGQGGRLASGEFYMLGVLRLHFSMYTLREGESTQYLDIFVESAVAPSDNFTLYSRSRQTTDWGNLLKTAAEIEGTSEEVMLKDNGGTSTIVLKELGYITRR